MTHALRPYHPDDFPACRDIVAKVWDMEAACGSKRFADALARFYFKASLSVSARARILEADQTVRGFLLGRMDGGEPDIPRVSMAREFAALASAVGADALSKLKWATAAWRHERASARALKERAFEICLLAITPGSQGSGGGRKLVEDHIGACLAIGADQISLETDAGSNWRFYERLGFVRVGAFNSPLQARFTGKDGETFVYRLDLRARSTLADGPNPAMA